MKALTVFQPFAQLLVLGVKRYETRSWKTKYRGRLIIHAGRSFPEPAQELCGLEPFHDLLRQAGVRGPAGLPRGVLLGTITLEDCVPTDEVLFSNPDERELALGDFGPGMWAWRMSDPQWLACPVPYQGRLGLFEVPDQLLLSPNLGDGCLNLPA